MSDPTTPPGSPEFEFEFELTDFDEARRILDLPPAGVAESRQLGPDYWAPRRRLPAPMDRALTGDTMGWVIGLPSDVRPGQLCERFPRIANAVAQAWATKDQFESLLADLLTDRRGRRHGLPIEVQHELERLKRYRATSV
jgi:hypothetical protein